MKKNHIKLFIIVLLLAFSPALFTCSPSGGDATVTINLGFTHDEASNRPFIDRILGFFSTEAYAQPPANINKITVRVEGPDMPTMEFDFDPGLPTLTLFVPSGSSRKFTVLANTPSATLGGSAERDLEPVENVSISITMGLFATKLVIPDFFSNRILQIDDIEDSTFISNSVNQPYDIDFDSRGRIYVAKTNPPGVERIDDINDTNFIQIVGDFSIESLAIDRTNNILYYASSSELYSSNLDGSNPTNLSMNSDDIQSILGMSVDGNGILYIAGTEVSGGFDRIFRYNPQNAPGSRVTVVYDNTTILSTPWDTQVKPPYVYVTNLYGADGERVLQLNMDLLLVDSYGNEATTVNTSQGMFYGPRKFLKVLNEKIIIIDDRASDSFDKLVSMDDIDGNGWATLPTSGDGQSLFLFYSGIF